MCAVHLSVTVWPQQVFGQTPILHCHHLREASTALLSMGVSLLPHSFLKHCPVNFPVEPAPPSAPAGATSAPARCSLRPSLLCAQACQLCVDLYFILLISRPRECLGTIYGRRSRMTLELLRARGRRPQHLWRDGDCHMGNVTWFVRHLRPQLLSLLRPHLPSRPRPVPLVCPAVSSVVRGSQEGPLRVLRQPCSLLTGGPFQVNVLPGPQALPLDTPYPPWWSEPCSCPPRAQGSPWGCFLTQGSASHLSQTGPCSVTAHQAAKL